MTRILAFLLAVATFPAFAQDPDLEDLRQGKSSIRISGVEGSKARRGVIRGVIDAPPDEVFRVVSDIEHYVEFIPKTKEVRIQEQRPGYLRYYNKINLPWPISDLFFDVEAFLDPGQRRLTVKMVPGSSNRLKSFEGGWALTTFEGNPARTLAVYEIVYDAKQHFPAWMEDMGTRSTLGKMIAAVRERVVATTSPVSRPPAPEGSPGTAPGTTGGGTAPAE
jgi:ribosome-associated toxin RatA of RatAB toxin-antitoxin module